jgi:enamine deaminase RidA (YjgF/YER057c/UK114 family)
MAPMTEAVARRGRTLFLGGHQSVSPGEEPLTDDSFIAHYERAFEKLVASLEDEGATSSDLVSIHTFVTEAPDGGGATGAVHHRYVGSGENRPASTLFMVSALASPAAKVELTGIAVL